MEAEDCPMMGEDEMTECAGPGTVCCSGGLRRFTLRKVIQAKVKIINKIKDRIEDKVIDLVMRD
jgi:hypothetical protein